MTQKVDLQANRCPREEMKRNSAVTSIDLGVLQALANYNTIITVLE